MNIRGRKTKKCPRCGNECLLSQVKCDECGLLFGRLEDATNKAGKKRLLRGQKEFVIYVKRCKDVKKWKLILITIFLGLFGGHYFYVGKWIKGLLMMLYFFAVLFMGVVFNQYFLTVLAGNFYTLFGPLTGVYTIIWLNDIRRVCFSTFKMPVSILSDEENNEYLNEKQRLKDEKKEIKNLIREKKKAIVKQDKEETLNNKQEDIDTAVIENKEIEVEKQTEIVVVDNNEVIASNNTEIKDDKNEEIKITDKQGKEEVNGGGTENLANTLDERGEQ